MRAGLAGWRTLAGRVCLLMCGLARDGLRGLCSLAHLLYGRGERWVLEGKHAVYGIAITRMFLGGAMLGTMLSNWHTRLYTFGAGGAWTGEVHYPTTDFGNIWPVAFFRSQAMNDVAFTQLYLLLIAALVSFILGYRARLSLAVVFVMWVGFTQLNTNVQDQSDNLTRMIMIAMFFTAPSERWSLDARRRRRFEGQDGNVLVRLWRFQPVAPVWLTSIFHNFAIVIMGAQACMIYVAGGLYKAGGSTWQNGTAIYNPIHTRQFGTWPELSHLVGIWAPFVGIATVMTVLVQVSFPGMLLRRGTRIVALFVILGFHLGIATLMGLPWFSMAMLSVDALFIRDQTWCSFTEGLTRRWSASGGETAPSSELGEAPVVAEPAVAAWTHSDRSEAVPLL